MSSRERWIVYPLLFLTFGIVMRDKIVPQAQFQSAEIAAGRIRCGQLKVDQVAVAGRIAVRSLECGDFRLRGQGPANSHHRHGFQEQRRGD